MTRSASTDLAHALQREGYTAADIGRALNPHLPRNAVYKAGMRVRDASCAINIDRLGELARELDLTITITRRGLEVQAPERRG